MTKIVLITGTSSGLGLHIAVALAKKGHTVYASMRNLEKKEAILKEAKKNNVTIITIKLDVTDPETIQNSVDTIIEKESRLDILINNAGAGFAKSTEQATLKEIDWVTDVNYFGVVRCTKAVLPYMRTQRSGHIINISSVGGLVGQPFNELYCASKFAVEGYTEALATYLTEPFGIKFTIIEPGGIATAFSKSATEKTMVSGGFSQDEYLPILQKYIAKIQKRSDNSDNVCQKPKEVAEVILTVIENPNPPLRIRTSQWAEELCELKTKTDPDGTKLVQQVIDTFLK